MATNSSTNNASGQIQNVVDKPAPTNTVAIIIIILSGAVLIALIIMAWTKLCSPQFSNAKDLFGIVLPIIGTWMGTVLAYYFSKENFKAASDSNVALMKQITGSDDKLKATNVSDDGVMRLLKDISYNKDIASKDDKDILVQKDLIGFIDENKKGDRLPILNDKNILRYIIHESTLNEFVRKFSTGNYDLLKATKLEEISLDQMINNTDGDLKNKIIKSAAFVSKSATLFEANQKMINNPLCQDVFVTDSGNENETVIGWITNNRIAELAKV